MHIGILGIPPSLSGTCRVHHSLARICETTVQMNWLIPWARTKMPRWAVTAHCSTTTPRGMLSSITWYRCYKWQRARFSWRTKYTLGWTFQGVVASWTLWQCFIAAGIASGTSTTNWITLRKEIHVNYWQMYKKGITRWLYWPSSQRIGGWVRLVQLKPAGQSKHWSEMGQ